MPLSGEIQRGQSNLSDGESSEIGLGPDVTLANLKLVLDEYTAKVKVFTVAYNRKWMDGLAGSIHATLDFDGKWYLEDGQEVT